MAHKQKVLIVGAGFGGVKAALGLGQDDRFAVTVLSDAAEMRYYPTLYHTATGGRRANGSIPLADIFQDSDVDFKQGVAVSLDRKSRTITTAKKEVISYDTLILSLGVITNYFGTEGLEKFSYSIKTQAAVEKFKAHLHNQLEDERRPDLHYVIVGAGPTGIELAGALPEYLKFIINNHNVGHREYHIDLVEAAPRLLPAFPRDTGIAVTRQLRKLGIRIRKNSVVQGETADTLTVSGKPIRSHTVIWTAGVANHPFFAQNGFAIAGRGKVAVNTYLEAEPNIFVIGDNANTPFSGTAQTALRDGEFVAKNIKRKASGKDMKSYMAKRPVTVITAGPKWAAVIWGRLRIYGWLGWVLRETSDFVGFHDLEPWDLATKQWLTDFGAQDSCPICATALSNK